MKAKKLLLLALVLTLTSSLSFAGKNWEDSFKIGKTVSANHSGKETCTQIWNTDGQIFQDGDDLYLYGGEWTNGKLVNGRKDGNAVMADFVHLFKNARFDMIYTVYGDDYCEFGCGLMPKDATWEEFNNRDKGYNTAVVSTGRSEDGSNLVASGTTIYVSFIFDKKGNSVLEAVSTGGFFDEEGSNILFMFPYDVCIKEYFNNRDYGNMVFYLNNNEGGANSYMVINDIEITSRKLEPDGEGKDKDKEKEDTTNKIIVTYTLDFKAFRDKDKKAKQNANKEENNNNANNNNNNLEDQYPNFAIDSADSWAVDGINSAKDKGVYTVGMMEQDFKEYATREEFTEMALLLFEKMGGTINGNENPFIDTTNESIVKAYNAGIINGISENRFAPDDLLSRQQFCTIVLRILDKVGASYDTNVAFQKEYADLDQIADWAYQSVRIMNGYNIMNGDGDRLMPRNNVTREQAVIMLERIYTSFYLD